MPKHTLTLTLALAAIAAIAAGLAAHFIELTILGIISALAAAALWLRSVRSAPGRG